VRRGSRRGRFAKPTASSLEATIARYEILRTTFPQQVGMRGRSQAIHDSLAPEWSVVPDGPIGDPGDRAWLSTVLAGRGGARLRPRAGAAVAGAAPRPGAGAQRARAERPPGQRRRVFAAPGPRRARQGYGGGGEPDEPVQYADYAEWRHELITGEDDAAADGRAFWRQDADGPAGD